MTSFLVGNKICFTKKTFFLSKNLNRVGFKPTSWIDMSELIELKSNLVELILKFMDDEISIHELWKNEQIPINDVLIFTEYLMDEKKYDEVFNKFKSVLEKSLLKKRTSYEIKTKLFLKEKRANEIFNLIKQDQELDNNIKTLLPLKKRNAWQKFKNLNDMIVFSEKISIKPKKYNIDLSDYGYTVRDDYDGTIKHTLIKQEISKIQSKKDKLLHKPKIDYRFFQN